MIWQGIYTCEGKTKVVFVTNKTTASKLYKKECLKKRALSFIRNRLDRRLLNGKNLPKRLIVRASQKMSAVTKKKSNL